MPTVAEERPRPHVWIICSTNHGHGIWWVGSSNLERLLSGSLNCNCGNYSTTHCSWGPDSSVGIATGYGLDDQGIESRWGRDFSHTSRPVLWSTQPPVQWGPGLFWG
jgi:hypothetical protein